MTGATIFGNTLPASTLQKALQAQQKLLATYGDDRRFQFHYTTEHHPVLEELGGRMLIPAAEPLDYGEVAKPLLLGCIANGTASYRTALALCSAARALGYMGLWFDLGAYPGSGASRRFAERNEKQQKNAALAQRSPLFQNLYWEKMHAKNARSLTQNYIDQCANELLVPLYMDFDVKTPMVATHAFAAQSGVHAHLEHVVNALPGNCAYGTHLAEGSVHVAQTPYSYLSYKMLRGMGGKQLMQSIPEYEIVNAGHFVDHLMIQHLERDCDKRIARAKNGSALRWLISLDELCLDKVFLTTLFDKLTTLEKEGRAVLLVNIGKHKALWEELKTTNAHLRMWAVEYPDEFGDVKSLTNDLRTKRDLVGIHVFSSTDEIINIYTTNLLMRGCDILVSRACELAFYPIPKLIARREGREDFWGGLHCSEIGEATFECFSTAQLLQMVDVLDRERDIFISMCKCIQKNQSVGMYSGAYEAVRLATE
ncbi:MAG: hypothetical protein KBG54_03850 [Oscillospiraceae bacterium]|nr:hypothetical protein [Oscillospiraceae bacterium]